MTYGKVSVYFPCATPYNRMGACLITEIETKKEHESFFTTTYASLVNWARKSSLWPYPFGTACCAIEFMSVVSSHYDIARFGSEVVRFSPKQSDVLMVLGTINDKMGPVLKQIYDQMAEPKWVISMGACATCGGFYRAYHVMQGIDEIIPAGVELVHGPGCPVCVTSLEMIDRAHAIASRRCPSM